MTRLGRAGVNLLDLNMEMNHNFFSVLYCKENNLPYMENGEVFNRITGNGPYMGQIFN